MAAASSSGTVTLKYDVFLSFSGTDTRQGFTNTLFDYLKTKGIEVFVDDRLPRGEQIEASLMRTVGESMIAVVIFSENYASSSWCLDELVKIKDCDLVLMPIFYKVKPEHVLEQSGLFGDEFAKLKRTHTEEKIKKWSDGLTFAATNSGWDLANYRTDIDLIKDVATCILNKLDFFSSSGLSSRFIGITSLVDDLREKLANDLSSIQFMGIWGMGGIGKTTIAEALYHQLSRQFDECYFAAVALDIDAYGVVNLRNKIVSKILHEYFDEQTPSQPPAVVLSRLQKKKVLIVLDNISSSNQVTTLVGTKADPWFAYGTKVIVTSRDSGVFKNEDMEVFEMKEMNKQYAHRLFCLRAFKQIQPPDEDYAELSAEMIEYAKGVPLVVTVLGRHLYSRPKDQWRSTLETLETRIDPEIEGLLMISYNDLNNTEKAIFLDIACFFKGYDKDRVQDILDGCGFSTTIGIARLSEKCLVTLNADNKLEMHDLLQKMGQDIARNQSGSNLGKPSRIWTLDDCHSLLASYQEAKANKGKTKTFEEMIRAIEGISLSVDKEDTIVKLNIQRVVSKMQHLRLLEFHCNYHFSYSEFGFGVDRVSSNYGGFCLSSNYSRQRFKDWYHRNIYSAICSLPNSLRFLLWDGYAAKFLPSNFSAENLVELWLHHSKLKHLWKGNKNPLNLGSLKVLSLVGSDYLTSLPDLTSAVNIKEMNLDGCIRLLEIPPSIQHLQNLSILNLRFCRKLSSLPSLVNIKALKILDLFCCKRLKNFPEVSEDIEILELYGTAITEWPDSMSCFNNLKVLEVSSGLEKLPHTLHLSSVEKLNLSYSRIQMLPAIIGGIRKLEVSCSNIRELPSSIFLLSSLVELDLSDCNKLSTLPNNFDQLNCLEALYLNGCSQLFERSLVLQGLNSIKKLHLGYCKLREFPAWVCTLSTLQALNLSGNDFVNVPDNIRQLVSLEVLDLSNCVYLRSLPAQCPWRMHNLDVSSYGSSEEVESSSFAADTGLVDGFEFHFVGCLNLSEGARRNIMNNAMIRIQHMANTRKEDLIFTVSLPGNEIPESFKIHEGSSITLELPADWSNDMFRGFVLGIVVDEVFRVGFECLFRVADGSILNFFTGKLDFPWILSGGTVCLSYFPVREIEKRCRGNHKDATHATFNFGLYLVRQKTLKCGVYLVYADLER